MDPSKPSLSNRDVLQTLVDGNARFVASRSAHPNLTAEHRIRVADAQHPFAAILCCSDSRVAPELVFDQGLGDLYVVRNAANLVDTFVLGSLEYAVEQLKVRLLVVLGHSSCGTIAASVVDMPHQGHMRRIVQAIKPAVQVQKGRLGNPVNNTARILAGMMAQELTEFSTVIKEAVDAKGARIVAGFHDIKTGIVEFFGSGEEEKTCNCRTI